MQAPTQTPRVCFGPFEADLCSCELRKHGLRVKLQDQPFQVLRLLLQRPGEMISRKELREKLWPADTFVDFDTGLNTAIKKLRDALGDSAEEPRYIETLPRRGYRLIVPVEKAEADPGAQEQVAELPLTTAHAEKTQGALLTEGTKERDKTTANLDLSCQAKELKPRLMTWRKAAVAVTFL